MDSRCRYLFFLVAVFSAVWFWAGGVGASLPVQPDPAVEAVVDSLVREAIGQVFAGRLDLAHSAIDRVQAVAPGDPRIGLTRFRILRENYPISLYKKERARALAPPMLAALESAIAQCDSMLLLDGNNAAAYLYRGWAHVMMGQTHLIGRWFRAAASDSRSAKSDFDRFYDLHPQGDPDADLIWGGYLYYADMLPGFFKFLRWIIRVPGGDVEEGLERMRRAAAQNGYTSVDAKLVLAATLYLFEGRLEESRDLFDDLFHQFPHYPWVVEYRSSLAYLFPENQLSAIAAGGEIIDRWGKDVVGWDRVILNRVLWSRARLLRQCGRYNEAIADLAAIAVDDPSYPIQVTPGAALSAIELQKRTGMIDEARRWCGRLRGDGRLKGYEETCGTPATETEIAAFSSLGRARRALSEGQLLEARRIAEETAALYGEDAEVLLVEAEIDEARGLKEEAFDEYAAAASADLDPKNARRRVIALMRSAEIAITLGRLGTAKAAYEEAREIEPRETMFANLIRGRIRFLKTRPGS